MAQMRRVLTYQGVEVWRHTKVIQWTLQIVSGIVVVVLVAWFFANIANAVQDREIPHGWGFLDRAYQTPIGQTFIPYQSSDSYGYALIVAIVNTVVVSVVGVILATMLGIFIGVARLSSNWLVSKLAMVYIEFFRNVPLLIQLFFWFYIILSLPQVRDGYVIGGGLYINNGGFSIPFPNAVGFGPALAWPLLALAGIAVGFRVYRALLLRETNTGQPSHPLYAGVATAVIIGAISWIAISLIAGDSPFVISSPQPEGRFGRIGGGFTAPAGLVVLLVGLVTYTASFIAEIVRAGIQSVRRGQTEAARALGLSPMETLRYVTFPQALRVIIPPLISQFLNLTKNSSLAGAIGYSDLTNVAKTMTQTAPAVSIFILIMAAYLAMSLTYSLIGNLYNRHIRFTGG
jgi:general L-amino acid transport system permease protein